MQSEKRAREKQMIDITHAPLSFLYSSMSARVQKEKARKYRFTP